MCLRRVIARILKSLFSVPSDIKSNVAKRVLYRITFTTSVLFLIIGIFLKPLYAPPSNVITNIVLIVGGVFSMIIYIFARYRKYHPFTFSLGIAIINFILIILNGGAHGPCIPMFLFSYCIAMTVNDNLWKKINLAGINSLLGLSTFIVSQTSPLAIIPYESDTVFIIDSIFVYVSLMFEFMVMCYQVNRSVTYHNIHERRKFDQFRKESLLARQNLMREINLDPMTGAFNKGFAKKLMDNLIDGKNIKGEFNIVVALFDIDYFKRVNDTHGHAIGDQVLIGVANSLKDSIRRSDYVIRYGGEEFLIVMTNTPFEEACNVIEHIRIETGIRVYSEKKLRVTMSAGIAEIRSDEPYESAVERADKCLYYAKRNGRNKSASSVPEGFSINENV